MTKDYETMGQNPGETTTKGKYLVVETGEYLQEKPEHMTQLLGNKLVSKRHPRIAFRGELDYLSAKVLELTAWAAKENHQEIAKNLEEVLDRCRKIMTTEALETPLEPVLLFGLTEGEIRAQSHHPKAYFGVDHPLPNAQMNGIALGLNTLRTEVRRCELAAINAHEPETQGWQGDILREMNRLSSAVYLLYCKFLGQETTK